MGVDLGGIRHLADGLAGPDDGDRVGEAQHLVELVGDEDRRRPGGGELAHRGEQLVDLVWHEDRGRLVEDDDLGAAVEHLEDLGALLLADPEIAHERVRVDLEAVSLAEVAQLADRDPATEVPWRARLVAEHDVLPDREVVGQLEVLEDHPDADRDRVARRAEVLFDTVDDDRPLVGAVGPVERLHQRRLSRAVLADDGVDRAGANRHVDPVVGHDTREALDDVPQLDRDRPLGRGVPHGSMF